MSNKKIQLKDSAGNNLYPAIVKQCVLDVVYPIGSIYITMNNTNPKDLFGGTWERIQDKFLLASGSSYGAGTTGGEATHKLTIQEMPQHSHDIYYAKPYTEDTYGNSYVYGQRDNKNRLMIEPEGGSQPHNNMPPYLAVYIWKRTA